MILATLLQQNLMDNIYLYMIIALAILAVADLVVGVSNDAVNFLNSAIGSKAISFKTIMIVASLGVAVGAVFSSGMMEVARKGIFNPGEFMFNEIMIIFMAVMITDILLLDFFNSVGMPTSTTVSIVFELLGAAVAMALIKIGHDGGFIANNSTLFALVDADKAFKIKNDSIRVVSIGTGNVIEKPVKGFLSILKYYLFVKFNNPITLGCLSKFKLMWELVAVFSIKNSKQGALSSPFSSFEDCKKT